MHALIAQLRAGVDALRAGAHTAAIPLLTAVANDSALAAAPDLQDIRARALSLLGQAHFQDDQPTTALDCLDRAIALLEDIAATEEIAPILELREEALAAIAGSSVQPQSLPMLAADLDPLDPAEHMLRLATMLYEANEPVKALDHALALLDFESVSARSEVIARLLISELDPKQAQKHLQAGWECAEAADEFNLVAAVAKRARALNITVGLATGPST